MTTTRIHRAASALGDLHVVLEWHVREMPGVLSALRPAADLYLSSGKNSVLMHDLRFEVDGEVAQIDHLLLRRAAGIMLFETKNFNGNLRINQRGEFSGNYGAREYGIPSPLEQSRRHANVLKKRLVRLDIAPRLGNEMESDHRMRSCPSNLPLRFAAALQGGGDFTNF